MHVWLAPDNGQALQRSLATGTPATGTPATGAPATETPARRARPLHTMAVDILAPIGLYYGIRAAGSGPWRILRTGVSF